MTIIVIVIFIIILLRLTLYWKAMELSHIYKDKILYFGHRGLRYEAPENTLPSYEAAIKSGLSAIELDVRLTTDRKIICSHNLDLERETTGKGFIDELSYEQVLKINAGRSFPTHGQTKIPTLEEVLEKLPENILINIEIKADSFFDLETAKELAKLIQAEKIIQPIIVSSFNPLVVRYIKLRSKNTPTGFIYEYAKHFIGVFIAHPDCLHPDAEFIDDKLIKFCKIRKMKINAWTVNNSYARNWLVDKGIDGIITDNPNVST